MAAPSVTSVDLVPQVEIELARARLAGIARQTPLVPSRELSLATGADVRLKCESLQVAGSFKVRGAYNCLAQLDRETLNRGVVTYSSGNHAQGVALAAQHLGTRVTAVMPVTAPAIKQDAARRLGAEVVLEGRTSVERRVRAQAIAAETGAYPVPGFDDPRIIAGQGTIGAEIVDEWPEVDTVIVPCGGGGLLSGIAVAIRAARPHARVIGVEPARAPSMTRALAEGAPVLLDATQTIADGLAAVRVGERTLEHTRRLVEGIVLVEEAALVNAARWLLTREKLVVEFSGASGVAALQTSDLQLKGRRVAIVLSGGNVDPSVIVDFLRTAA